MPAAEQEVDDDVDAGIGGAKMRYLMHAAGVALVALAASGATPMSVVEASPDLSEVPIQVPASALAQLPVNGAGSGAEVMLAGDVDSVGGAGLDAGSTQILAQAWPADEVLAGQAAGATFTLLPIALSDTAGDGTFELRVDPEQIPAEYVGGDGIVDLSITLWDGSTVAETSASVAVDQGGEGFVDPLAVDLLEQSREPDAAVEVVEAADALGNAPVLDLAHSVVSDQESVDKSTFDKPWVECDVTLTQRGIYAWARVGEGLPVSGQTTSFTFSNTQTVSLGIGVSSSGTTGTWSASGTTSKSAGFSQEWAASSTKRYYRVQTELGRYTNRCYTVSGGSRTYAYTNYEMRPLLLTGGTDTLSTTLAPTWNNCAPVAAGTWSRSASSANAYSNSAGLALPSPASISVTSTSQYNTSHVLRYHQSSQKTLCGNNAMPASAGRIAGKV